MKLNKSAHLFSILLVFCVQSSIATANEDWPYSVRLLSTGYIATSFDVDPLLILSNPSLLHGVEDWSVVSSYARPYGLKELHTTGVGSAKRLRAIVVVVGMTQFGFELYKEQKLFCGGTFPIVANFHLGFTMFYHHTQIKNYGQSNSMTFDIGWNYKINQKATITGAIHNIHRATIGQDKHPLPQILRMGLQYQPLKQINTSVELYKDLLFEPEMRFGVEAKTIESVYLRFGWTRNPVRFTSGIGLKFFGLSFDYGFSQHQVLGYTHAVGLIYSR